MLYVFVDESGNFDFTPTGTEYFVLSALSVARPFSHIASLMDLKYDLWAKGLEFEYFHAAEDMQSTRDDVFKILTDSIGSFRIDSVIVEKRKTYPALQDDHSKFYQNMFKILLRYVFEGHNADENQVSITTDAIPLNKKEKQIEKAIRLSLRDWVMRQSNSYSIQHISSKSDPNLQIVDYMNWAIYRKWSMNDRRSYDLIRECIHSEFDVFQAGCQRFY